MRAWSRSAAAGLLCALAPGCYYGHIKNDVDRTPTVDAGAGATIIMPGQSAPMTVPGESAGAATRGPALSTLGGSRIEEERHREIREEPVWWKYATLPFALVAAPFKLAADAARGKPEPGPELPETAPERPEAARSAPQTDYETARIQQLEQEIDRRGGSAPAPEVARTPAPPSISDELAALQRVPATPRDPASAPPAPARSTPDSAALRPAAPAASPADGIVDRNGDGRVDLWIYREEGRIARRVLDENFDGVPDRTLRLDPATGEVAQVEEDANEDGSIDAWTEYRDGEILRRRADADFDGSVDTWTFYQGGRIVRHEQDASGDGFRDRIGFYEDGRLVRDEVDSNGDGRPDTLNHYDASEQVVRREEDTDLDGSIDRVSHFEAGRLARREILEPEVR
jgi:hypothetical protein